MAAELLTRLFLSEITEALRADNSFMAYAKNDDAFVNNNSVELPHAGTDPTIVIDRSSFPASTAQRTDVATQYVLEELSSDPTHLQYSEELVVAYNKRASILEQHIRSLKEKKGDRCAYYWAAQVKTIDSTNQIPTTGTGTRASDAPGSTVANVKKLTKADILKGKNLMDKDNVPMTGRYLLIPPSMLSDILELDEFTRMDAYGKSNIPDGWVGLIFGFNVVMRSLVTAYDSSYDIKDTETATATTDVAGAIMYHRDSVRRANGEVKVFLNVERPEYYGSIISAATRFGAKEARNDGKGIVTIVETV